MGGNTASKSKGDNAARFCILKMEESLIDSAWVIASWRMLEINRKLKRNYSKIFNRRFLPKVMLIYILHRKLNQSKRFFIYISKRENKKLSCYSEKMGLSWKRMSIYVIYTYNSILYYSILFYIVYSIFFSFLIANTLSFPDSHHSYLKSFKLFYFVCV